MVQSSYLSITNPTGANKNEIKSTLLAGMVVAQEKVRSSTCRRACDLITCISGLCVDVSLGKILKPKLPPFFGV